MKMLVIALVLFAAGGQKGGGVRESVWAGPGGWLMGEEMPGRGLRMRKTLGSLS